MNFYSIYASNPDGLESHNLNLEEANTLKQYAKMRLAIQQIQLNCNHTYVNLLNSNPRGINEPYHLVCMCCMLELKFNSKSIFPKKIHNKKQRLNRTNICNDNIDTDTDDENEDNTHIHKYKCIIAKSNSRVETGSCYVKCIECEQIINYTQLSYITGTTKNT